MKLILLGVCISLLQASLAQVSIINRSLTDSSLNVVYIGVYNHIKIKTSQGISNYQLITKGANSALTKTGDTEYDLMVHSMDTCVLTITKQGKVISKKSYKPAPLPAGYASLNGLYNVSVSKSRILANPFLTIVHPKSYYKHEYRIVSFTMSCVQESDSVTVFAQGDLLNNEQLRLIRRLYAGDTIHFENIRIVSPYSRTATIPSFSIKIE